MDVSALLIYLMVQGITPGPSNLMSLYTSAALGFRGARGYRIGTMTGFMVKILLCGLLNMMLAAVVPGLVPYLKWVGAAYLLYLAAHILFAGKNQQQAQQNIAATFWGGILLQVLNIKSWVMGLTMFSLYIIPFTTAIQDILFWTLVTFPIMLVCTLIWSLFGNAIKRIYEEHRLALSIVMAALLLYSAVSAVL